MSFDKVEILEKTLQVFWQSGYLGASYSEICGATGLTKPSLYSAFGNKEETFLAALSLYLDRFVRPGLPPLEAEPNPREAIRKLLIATAEGLTAKDTPPGCMIAANIASSVAPVVPHPIAVALLRAAKETPDAIRRRLQRAKPAELPHGSTPDSLALFCEALISGLSGLARQGMRRENLLKIVDTAMLVWPVSINDCGTSD
ncbi:MAG: TetR/AcrR family transcriptional regulator [Burkholderiaceae bacterium]